MGNLPYMNRHMTRSRHDNACATAYSNFCSLPHLDSSELATFLADDKPSKVAIPKPVNTSSEKLMATSLVEEDNDFSINLPYM
jgi:hypothetical protein